MNTAYLCSGPQYASSIGASGRATAGDATAGRGGSPWADAVGRLEAVRAEIRRRQRALRKGPE